MAASSVFAHIMEKIPEEKIENWARLQNAALKT